MSMSCLITGSLIDKQKYMLLTLAGFADETDEHCSKLAAGMHGVARTSCTLGSWQEGGWCPALAALTTSLCSHKYVFLGVH